MEFKLHAPFKPMGDQPEAIRGLVDGVKNGLKHQVLLGATGTGIVVAAYRMKQQGWSLTDAETEMQAFGFNDVWVNFKKFIRGYGKELGK